MQKLTLVPMVLLGYLIFTNLTAAQSASPVTAAPATKLGSLEATVSVVVLKGTTDLGSVPGKAGAVAVKCREVTDTSTGQKERGIALEITQKDQPKDVLLVDYDEIARLLSAIEYVRALDPTVTPLAAFDAAYTTKGGLRVAALGTRRTGAVQFAVRDVRLTNAPVVLSPEGMASFSGLISQARTVLDSLADRSVAAPAATFAVPAASPGTP